MSEADILKSRVKLLTEKITLDSTERQTLKDRLAVLSSEYKVGEKVWCRVTRTTYSGSKWNRKHQDKTSILIGVVEKIWHGGYGLKETVRLVKKDGTPGKVVRDMYQYDKWMKGEPS